MAFREFQQAMHAFASLISMETISCGTTDHTCVLKEENGWIPGVYFDLQREFLKDILSNLPTEMGSSFASFIQRQASILSSLQAFNNANKSDHLEMVKQAIRYVGKYTFYPWGTQDHQVYMQFNHVEHGKYQVTIYDLGAGRDPVRSSYQPIIRNFNSASAFHDFVGLLARTQNATPSAELYSYVYEQSLTVCTQCVPEKSQTTGNCVVKNLLALTKQEANDQHPKIGEAIFQHYYLELIKASLRLALKAADGVVISSFPHLSEVCGYIRKSQQAFLNTSCDEVTTKIGLLYAELKNKVAPRVQPVYAASATWAQAAQQPEPSFMSRAYYRRG